LNRNKIGEVTITKEMMFKFLDGMKKHWDKNPENKKFSDGIILMKTGLHLQEDNVVQAIVSEMFRAIIALEQWGAFKEMKEDETYNSRIEFFADNLITKIESGEFFGDVKQYAQ